MPSSCVQKVSRCSTTPRSPSSGRGRSDRSTGRLRYLHRGEDVIRRAGQLGRVRSIKVLHFSGNGLPIVPEQRLTLCANGAGAMLSGELEVGSMRNSPESGPPARVGRTVSRPSTWPRSSTRYRRSSEEKVLEPRIAAAGELSTPETGRADGTQPRAGGQLLGGRSSKRLRGYADVTRLPACMIEE